MMPENVSLIMDLHFARNQCITFEEGPEAQILMVSGTSGRNFFFFKANSSLYFFEFENTLYVLKITDLSDLGFS